MREVQGSSYKLPDTPQEKRQFDSWLLDVTRRPFATSGVERTWQPSIGPDIADRVRTTRAWSAEQGIPVIQGALLRIAFDEGRKLGLVMPRYPSLIDGDAWLPFDALERDD